jgi:alpha(1,3/1,4) fucosyltransferase
MKIKIDFCDFWPGFDKTNNYFFNLLKEDYEIEISNNPDYLFFSIFGISNLKYSCKKIFFSGENIGPDFNKCDYSMCFDWLDDERHYRLPLYILYDGYYDLVNKKVDETLINRKFCNFIVSNGSNQLRNNFFIKLCEYKKVDSGGRFMNNIGTNVDNKLKFQSDYKFSIAFENNAHRINRIGYTTEKIMESMKVNSIPIYWGNEWVDRDFNKESFINYYDFKSEDELIEYIIYLDQNDDKYMEILNKPWFINNEIPESNKKENIKRFVKKIIES